MSRLLGSSKVKKGKVMSLADVSKEVSEGEETVLNRLYSHTLCNLYDLRRYWIGKILTITDASAKDEEQRKAFKDLVNDAFYSQEYITDEIARHFRMYGEATKTPFNRMACDKPNAIAEEKNPYQV